MGYVVSGLVSRGYALDSVRPIFLDEKGMNQSINRFNFVKWHGFWVYCGFAFCGKSESPIEAWFIN
jgi:hypothetical protein